MCIRDRPMCLINITITCRLLPQSLLRLKYREIVKQYSRGTKKRTWYEKSVHKAIQKVTSNNDKLRNISIILLNNISNSKSMGVRMQRINVIDIIKSKQMTIE